MKIQSITKIETPKNINRCKNLRKTKLETTPVSFKANYNEVMSDVIRRDLRSRYDVEKSISDLSSALMKEKEIKTTPLKSTLSDWQNNITGFVLELCKPIAKVRSDLRDIIFNSRENNLPIIQKPKGDLLYIMNFGKHGFWNSLLGRKEANNDMRMIFASESGMFEVCTNSNHKLESNQYFPAGAWTQNTYDNSGNRIKQKTGNSSDNVIVPQI